MQDERPSEHTRRDRIDGRCPRCCRVGSPEPRCVCVGFAAVSRRPARSTAALGLLLSVLATFGAVACSDGGSNTPTAKEQAASTPAPPAGGAPTAGRAAQTTPAAPTAPTAPRDLPRGGRTVLPSHRVVAFYGEGYPGGIGLLNVN